MIKPTQKNQVRIVDECTLLILSSSPLKYFSNKLASFELAKLSNSYNNSLYWEHSQWILQKFSRRSFVNFNYLSF